MIAIGAPSRWLWPIAAVVGLGLMALAFSLAGPGCAGPARQAAVVDAVAVAGSAAVRLIAAAERADGMRAIEQSSSIEDARARLAEVEDRWSDAWAVVDALAVAQDAAARELEQGGEVDAATLAHAYCALRELLEGSAPLPAIPGLECER